MIHAIRAYFTELFGRFGAGWNQFWFTPSDPLMVCLLRIMTGLVALYAHATYGPDLVRFFAAGGLLSAETVREWVGPQGGFTYLFAFDDAPGLGIIHVAGFAVLLLFTLGLFTRITSVLALIVTLSYIHRAPMLTSLLEPILTMVMFYLCLAPCGAYLSLDRVRRRRGAAARPPIERVDYLRVEPSITANVATRLIQLHLAMVYLSMGVAKLSGELWWDGTAVWWLLARPESRLVDLTDTLIRHPYLTNAWTHAIVLFELGFGLLVWNRLARPLMLTIAVVMWPLVILATGLWTFGIMMLVATSAFVSPEGLRGAIGHLIGRSEAASATGGAREAKPA